jgi:hypothetical protein
MKVDTGKFQKKVEIKTANGIKCYEFEILHRREAARIFHSTLTSIAGALAGALDAKGGVSTEAIFKAIKSIDFDTIWDLAESLLRHCSVDGVELGPLDESDYYQDNQIELYLAIWHAINANFPSVFSKVREKIKGSNFADALEKAEVEMSITR